MESRVLTTWDRANLAVWVGTEGVVFILGFFGEFCLLVLLGSLDVKDWVCLVPLRMILGFVGAFFMYEQLAF